MNSIPDRPAQTGRTSQVQTFAKLAGDLSRLLANGYSPLEACRHLSVYEPNRELSRILENITGLLQDTRISLFEAFAAQNTKLNRQFFPAEFLICLDNSKSVSGLLMVYSISNKI